MIEPPVALVSAARATPSYTNLINHFLLDLVFDTNNDQFLYSYLENEATNGGTGFHVAHCFLARFSVGHESCVTQTIVIIEATLRQSVDVVQFHFLLN